MLSVIKHAGKQSGKQSGKQARKRESQQPRKQGQSLKKSEPCPLGACCFWNSRERAQERGLKEEGSRKRAQEGGLKRELKRESSRESSRSTRTRAQEVGAMPCRGLLILGNASF